MLTRVLNSAERRMSTHARFHPHSWFMPTHRSFRAADVIHYHIVHDGYMALEALPFLTRLKPSLWTWHDPWTMTGHCVYPIGCDRWESGCGQCPDLRLVFAMRRDRTAQEFERKRRIYRKIRADIVVASSWMLDFARRSPLGEFFNFHLLPFGIDLSKFKPRNRQDARRRFGVLPGRKVIFVRSAANPYKGMNDFLSALSILGDMRSLAIIAFQEVGHFDRFIGRHQIIERDWTNDEDLLIDAFSACDVFAMPSKAEAFGLMAIEAMACGRAVVSFEGTSLPAVTFAPGAGMSVPMGDCDALAHAIAHLLHNEAECRVRGERSRRLAEQNYDIRGQAKRMADLYRTVADRRRSKVGARR